MLFMSVCGIIFWWRFVYENKELNVNIMKMHSGLTSIKCIPTTAARKDLINSGKMQLLIVIMLYESRNLVSLAAAAARHNVHSSWHPHKLSFAYPGQTPRYPLFPKHTLTQLLSRVDLDSQHKHPSSQPNNMQISSPQITNSNSHNLLRSYSFRQCGRYGYAESYQ